MRELDADRLAAMMLQTLEEAAFVFAERVEAPAPPFEGDVVEARLSWGGADARELRLAVSAPLAAALAADLLGVDEAPGRGEDAVGELVNMAAGWVVAELYGPADLRALGLPRVARRSAAAHAATATDDAVRATLVDEEGRRFDVALAAPSGSAP